VACDVKQRLNYLKSWCVFFAICSILTIYSKPTPGIPSSGGINWGSVFGLLISIGPFVAKEKGQFQAICVLYGISGGISIVLGIMAALLVFGSAAAVSSMGSNGHSNDADFNKAAHSASMIVIIVGMIPVSLIFCAATMSCCAMHYAHEVTNYLGVEGNKLEDLTSNKAAAAREYLLAPDGEDEVRIV